MAASTSRKIGIQNYETSLAVVCFHEANRDHRYDKLIKNADKFLKTIQWGGDAQPIDKSDPAYGGAGYGKHKRPDLSNTQFFLDALAAAGNGPDDPAVKRALTFVSRCQNLESEHNTTPFAAKNPDGGFYYTPAAGGMSAADKTPNGGLRSYASMTYAGLKSMIYAGVGPDDPRVKAALKWCQMHYGLDENPGLGKAGQYYYYQTFAKALDATHLTLIQDDKGVKHDWRRDLLTALVSRQRPNGSWVNDDRALAGERPLPGHRLRVALAGLCAPGGGEVESRREIMGVRWVAPIARPIGVPQAQEDVVPQSPGGFAWAIGKLSGHLRLRPLSPTTTGPCPTESSSAGEAWKPCPSRRPEASRDQGPRWR